MQVDIRDVLHLQRHVFAFVFYVLMTFFNGISEGSSDHKCS